jgi:predicted hotdog family 3-hydroxylacyl-ACP dehydratase
VSLRETALHVAILDDTDGTLTVSARRLMGDARGASYAFAVHAGRGVLAEGRAMVLFEAPP